MKGKMKTQFRSAFVLVHVNLLGGYFHYHRHIRLEVSLSGEKYTLTRATTNSIFQRRPQPLHYFCEDHNHRKISAWEYSQCNISTRTTTIARFPRRPLPMQYFHVGHYQCNISTRTTTSAIFPHGPQPTQYFHEGHYHQ